MAGLPPDGRYLIQQNDGLVSISDSYTGDELMNFFPGDVSVVAQAQKEISELAELDAEQKAFAHFWSGYFYAHATMAPRF